MVLAGYASLEVLPWLFKNCFWLQNPLAPLFNHLFRNPYFAESFETAYVQNLMHYRTPQPLGNPTPGDRVRVARRPVRCEKIFLLSPVALLALRWRPGRHLLLAAAVFGVTYFGNISTRFLLPALPFIALAMCLVLAEFPACGDRDRRAARLSVVAFC